MIETIALFICVPLLAYFLVKWFYTKDTQKEDRRRKASQFAAKATAYGLKDIPKLLTDYSVGDYSGLLHDFRVMLDKYLDHGDDAFEKELNATFDSVLKAKLATDAGRAYVTAKVAEFTPVASAPVAAPAV